MKNKRNGRRLRPCIAKIFQQSPDRAVALFMKHAFNADFVMTIMESYALRPEKMPKLQAILDKYSSLSSCPASWRMDVISVIIEMPGEMWAAQPEIKPKGISKKKRTIGEPEFRRFDGAAGRFADLLPIKSAGSTVH